MNCEEAGLLMMDALDGTLGPSDVKRLEAHLARCPVCQAEWTALQTVESWLSYAPLVSPAPGFADRVATRLARQNARRRLGGGLVVLAAAALLALSPLLQGWLLPLPLSPAAEVIRQITRHTLVVMWHVLRGLWIAGHALATGLDLSPEAAAHVSLGALLLFLLGLQSGVHRLSRAERRVQTS
ncbi:MAG: zf-HC2 domain-containing protein [Chloroflexi bacterium]|nr:MAG: zf-HC2 domain-containing protein [Chloroflexota bacterium]